jgi:hypothetical protein
MLFVSVSVSVDGIQRCELVKLQFVSVSGVSCGLLGVGSGYL